ncbi:hypothetical protein HS125_09440 [bacterium]|nr:hypothetical protein [bacterium]
MINLRELFALSPSQPLPESLYLALAILDDVQVEKLDAFTVKFHFPRKNYANLENAGYLRLVAEHYYDTGRKLTEHPKRDVPLGVGPYKFVKWDRNTSIVVERWEDYWGELAPSIQRVDFKIISDVVVAYQVFRKGDIDAMGSVGVWTYTQKSVGEQFDRHFYKLSYDRPGYEYVGYNCRRSFFSDPRCRQAMSHLIDTRAAVDNILLGLFPIVTGPYFYKEPGYDAELPRYEYNVEKAKALLDEAGWKDSDGDGVRDKDLNGDGIISDEPLDRDGNQREKFVFEYLTSDPDAQNSWVMLSFLRNGPKVGVVCRARSVEGALKLEWLRDKKWDAGGGGWVVGMESDPYTFFHSSQGADGFNFGGYASPRADRMMEAARQELDKEQRTRLFRQLHRILWEEQPYTFLIGHNWRWVLNKRVKNVRLYDLGLDFLEWELAGHESGT